MRHFELAQFACRITVPTLFFWTVGREFFALGRPNLAFSVIGGLICIFAIWMLFGVRTRIAALASLVLWSGWTSLVGPQANQQVALLMVIAVLCLPLIIAGGGANALYRKGWSGLI